MATLVVETGAGLTNSNSYSTQDTADTYHEMRLHNTDWTGASDDDKEAALMWATRLLDDQMDWDGDKASTTQALRWPRTSVVDPDDDDVSSTAIPSFLSEATAEYARLLIASDREDDSDTFGFKELRAGSLKMVIDKYDRMPALPLSVWTMVKSYGIRASGQLRTLVRK